MARALGGIITYDCQESFSMFLVLAGRQVRGRDVSGPAVDDNAGCGPHARRRLLLVLHRRFSVLFARSDEKQGRRWEALEMSRSVHSSSESRNESGGGAGSLLPILVGF